MCKRSTLLLLLVLLSSHVNSQNLYRYKNDAGGTVVDWHVPAEFAGGGYEVLSPDGEVIEVVPRKMTDAELANQDLVERLNQEAEAERLRLAELDKFLLLRYSTVEDIDAAKDRALRELNIRLSILASNQRVSRGRLEVVLARVADMERAGNVALPLDLEAISALQAEIETIGRAIEEREAQVVDVTREYDEDRQRFEQLQDVVRLRRSLSRDQTDVDD